VTATTPLVGTCPRCKARVLEVRWDYELDLVVGKPRLDLTVLSLEQITACIITGRDLWQLHEHAGRKVTSHRSRWWPRAPIDGTVHAEHRCGTVWPGTDVILAEPQPPAPVTEPPF